MSKYIRIGNDISLTWAINRDGDPEVFTGKRVKVKLIDKNGCPAKFDYTIQDNYIVGTFYGKDQKETGAYRLLLVENCGDTEMVTLDYIDCFILSAKMKNTTSIGEDPTTNIRTEVINIGSDIITGGHAFYTKDEIDAMFAEEDDKIEAVRSEIPSLDGYATEQWVEAQGYLKEHQDISGKADITYVDSEIARVESEIPSLRGYATTAWVTTNINTLRSEIPTRSDIEAIISEGGYATEQWVEGQGYLTEHQDISGKADITYVDEQIDEVKGDIPSLDGYATEQWVEGQGYLTEHQDISGKQDKLTAGANITIIDNVISATGSESDVTKAYVDSEIARVESEIPSLDGYATEDWVEGQGYLTEHQSLTGYATESWVNNQGFLTQHQDITGKADITYVDGQIEDVRGDIPSLTGYATEQWVEAQGYLTQHQSLKTLNGESLVGTGDIEISADTSEIEDVIATGYQVMNDKMDTEIARVEGLIPDVSDYYTKTAVDSKIAIEAARIDSELEKSDNIIATALYYMVNSNDVRNIIKMTQAEYDDIASPDEKTLYIITD